MQVYSADLDVFQGPDIVQLFGHFLIRNAELGISLAGIDALVGLRIDIGIDTKGYVLHFSKLSGDSVHDAKFLDGFAVDCENPLLDGIADFLVALPHAGIHDALRVETGLYRAAHFPAGGAVNAKTVFFYHLKDMRVVIGLDGIMDDEPVLTGHRHDALQGLPQEIDVIEIIRGFPFAEGFRYLSAEHILLTNHYTNLVIFRDTVRGPP